jgi:hypothetical protein
MPLESATFIADLVNTNPVGATDPKSEGDNHLRLIKTALQNTLPGANRAIKFNELPGAIEIKAGAYTVVAADAGKLFDCSGEFTLTLTAVATLGANFTFRAYNSGTSLVTVDPNASELINDKAAIFLSPGDFIIATCTGSKWLASRAGLIDIDVEFFFG